MLHFLDPAEEFQPLTREDPSAFSPPPAFGPFRVLHQVGVGALGPVFRTYEPTRDRLVAVKAFRLDIVPEQAQSLADAMSRATEAGLFHPSIVEPIAAGVEGTVAYRAEEYVAAESLDVAMRHYAPATVEKALPFITQLAGAIDFARAAGIGHGGLHPRDIFVTPDEARATGFGVVEALESVGLRAPIRRPYSAPERIAGEPWGTPADVFALGAIAYELLTGRRPAGTGAQIGPAPDVEHAGAVHGVLARAMHDEPSRRYISALAFAGALESAAHGESPTDAAAIVETISTSRPAPLPSVEDEADEEPVYAAPPDEEPVVQPDRAPVAEARPLEHPKRELPERQEPVEPPVLAPPDERFADDFADEQGAQAAPEAEEPAYEAPDFDLPVEPERSRPALLPMAIVGALMLLIGFGAGYFVRDRSMARPDVTTAAAAPSAPPPATAAPAREYSDQPVGQKPAAPLPETPPIIPEPAPAPSAPAKTTSPEPRPAEPRAGAPAAPLATRGRLEVRSTPPHAGVTVNGAWRGRTPLTIDGLVFGRYVVRIVQPGYRVASEEFTLSSRSARQTINTTLEREPGAPSGRAGAARPAEPPAPQGTFTGSLFVDSRPQGANVLLDGTIVGKTPLMLTAVKVGTHVVRIELAEHKPWSSTTRVTAGQEARVTGSLERFQ